MAGSIYQNSSESVNEDNRPQAMWFVLFLMLGSALRFFQLGRWSLWIEESHLMRDVQLYVESFGAILGNPRPLFYLLTVPIFELFGPTLVGARALSAFIGIVTILVVYVLTQRGLGSRVALVATFLLVMAPWHLFWSQNARFYTLLQLFYVLAYVCFYLVIETDRFVYQIFAFIFLGLAVLSHTIGAMLLPLFFLHYFVLKLAPGEKPAGLKAKNILPYIVLPIVGYILFEIFRVAIVGTNSLANEMYVKFVSDSTASFLGYARPWDMFSSVLYSIGFPLTIMSAYGAFDLIFVLRKRESFLLVLGAYAPFGIMILLTAFLASTTNRYVFMTLPFWIVLAASGVWRIIDLENSVIGSVLIGLIAVSLLADPISADIFHFASLSNLFIIFLIILVAGFVALLVYKFPNRPRAYAGYTLIFILAFHAFVGDFMYFAFQHGYRDNWQGPVARVEELAEPDDLVWTHLHPVGRYYLGDRVESLSRIEGDAASYADETIWIIEDAGAAWYFDGRFASWAAENDCEQVGAWDNYAAGAEWPMRLYKCET